MRVGDEKALAVRGQLLLELHYIGLRRSAIGKNKPRVDKALIRRAYLICSLLEESTDEELKRQFVVCTESCLPMSFLL